MNDPIEFLTARWDEEQRIAEAVAKVWEAHWAEEQRTAEVAADGVALPWTAVEMHAPNRGQWGVEYAGGEVLDTGGGYYTLFEEMAKHIALHDPARVLADIAAKRSIAELHTEWVVQRPDGTSTHHGVCVTCDPQGSVEFVGWPCPTLRLLAQPFRYHPDFDPAWTVQP